MKRNGKAPVMLITQPPNWKCTNYCKETKPNLDHATKRVRHARKTSAERNRNSSSNNSEEVKVRTSGALSPLICLHSPSTPKLLLLSFSSFHYAAFCFTFILSLLLKFA